MNSTRRMDEAHCRAIECYSIVTAQARQDIVTQKRLPCGASGSYASILVKKAVSFE